MKRRQLLKGAAAVSLLNAGAAKAAGDEEALEIVDSNVSLFRWPFRRLPLDETETLVEKMRALGIGSAIAGSFEGVFERDLSAVNERLAKECSRFPELHPVGSINPTAPGWMGDVVQCVDTHRMSGVRIHPGYHGYALDEPNVAKLFAIAAKSDIAVQIALAMEDARTQNDLARVPDVDITKLPEVGDCRVQLLNWKPRGAVPPGVSIDTARIEGTDGIARLLATVPAEQILFGSHAPFLIPEAALIRAVHENQLDEIPLRKILGGNANRLFAL